MLHFPLCSQFLSSGRPDAPGPGAALSIQVAYLRLWMYHDGMPTLDNSICRIVAVHFCASVILIIGCATTDQL